MSAAGKSGFWKHHPPRFLHNEVRETPAIPVRRVRKDVLFEALVHESLLTPVTASTQLLDTLNIEEMNPWSRASPAE